MQTEMVNAGARMMEMKEAPKTVEESSTKTIAFVSPVMVNSKVCSAQLTLRQLDKATRESTSGKFIASSRALSSPGNGHR